MILNEPVLVLNSGMVPISICNVRDAVLDIFRDVAIPIKESEALLRSPSTTIHAPSIISHYRYNKIPLRQIRINRLNIIYRDNQICQYCQKTFAVNELTLDHVIPRSRWKKEMGDRVSFLFHSWRNLVTACRHCNSTKGSRLLRELGWKLKSEPVQPSYLPALTISRKRAEQLGWIDFCTYNVRLL